jgi:hypothetical protein
VQIAALDADQRGLQRVPLLRSRVERRFPALSSWRAHRPAQEIKWPGLGKCAMSTPISATTTWATRSLIPGTVVSRRARSRIGARAFPTAASSAKRPLDGGDQLHVQLDHRAMVLSETAAQGFDQLAALVAGHPLRLFRSPLHPSDSIPIDRHLLTGRWIYGCMQPLPSTLTPVALGV